MPLLSQRNDPRIGKALWVHWLYREIIHRRRHGVRGMSAEQVLLILALALAGADAVIHRSLLAGAFALYVLTHLI